MATSSEGDYVVGWEFSVLFLMFMFISVAWQGFIGLITFLNSFYGGAKTIWLSRLKEEVLDVGVISLVLVFLYPYIAGICVTSSYTSSYPSPPPAAAPTTAAAVRAGPSPARLLLQELSQELVVAARRVLAGGGEVAACPAGKRHLFPSGSIANAHYLLFFVAFVHIIYSFFTFTLTLQRFQFWSKWERRARLEAMDAAEVLSKSQRKDAKRGSRCCCGLLPCACCCAHGVPRSRTDPSKPRWYCRPFVYGLRYLQGGIDRDRYMVLRGLFQLRSRAHRVNAFTDNLHYTNVCENAMEIDIAKMVAHGWLQALIVAIFTLYTTEVYQIMWIGGLSMIVQAIVVAKMESVVSRVLRIVTVAGSQSAPVYQIDTEAAEYQAIHTDSDSGEEGPPISSSSSSSSSGDERTGVREQSHTRAQTLRAPRTEPMAGVTAASRKYQSMDMRAADLSVPTMFQNGGVANGVSEIGADYYHAAPRQQRAPSRGAGAVAEARLRWEETEEERDEGALADVEDVEEEAEGEEDQDSVGGSQRWWRQAAPRGTSRSAAAAAAAAAAASGICMAARREAAAAGREEEEEEAVAAGAWHLARRMPGAEAGPQAQSQAAGLTGTTTGACGPVAEARDWLAQEPQGSSAGPSSNASNGNGDGNGNGNGNGSGSMRHTDSGQLTSEARLAPAPVLRGASGRNRSTGGVFPASGLTASLARKAMGNGQRQPGAGGRASASGWTSGSGRTSVPSPTPGFDRSESGALADAAASAFKASRNPLYDLEHLDSGMEAEGGLGLESSMWAAGTEDGEGRNSGTYSETGSAAAFFNQAGGGGGGGGGGGTASGAATSRLGAIHSPGVGSARLANGPAGAGPPAEGGSGAGIVQMSSLRAGTSSRALGSGVGKPKDEAKYANPLFREGSMVSTSFTNAARAAAALAARDAAAARTTAPLEDGGAAAAAAALPMPQPLRSVPSLRWRAPGAQSTQSGEAGGSGGGGGARGGNSRRQLGLVRPGSGDPAAAAVVAADAVADITAQHQQPRLLPAAAAAPTNAAVPPKAPSPLLLRTAAGAAADAADASPRAAGRSSSSANGAFPPAFSAYAAATASNGGHASAYRISRTASATGDAVPSTPSGGGGGGGPHQLPSPTPHMPKAAVAAQDIELMNAGVAEVDMGLVEKKLRGLFWFRQPQILIWISHVNFLQNSLSLTLCIYYLITYGTGTSILQVESRLLYIWLPLLGANLAFMVYMGWVVVPLYTLVSTTCVRNPRALQSHIRRHKKAEAEEEGGITGFTLNLLTRCFMRSHHRTTRAHAKHGAGDSSALNNLFMANLANQAGVIMASDAQLTTKDMGAAEAVYREYIDIWRSKVRIQQGLELPEAGGISLQADVSEFRSAFMALDADGSSTVTTDELFTHLHVLGTRATKTELKSMIGQIDNDGDKRVDFEEFVVFMVFCFFDENGNSCVEIPDIRKMCRKVKMTVPEDEAHAMMDLADPDGDRKIGLRQFFKLFSDVKIPKLGPRLANAELHGLSPSPLSHSHAAGQSFIMGGITPSGSSRVNRSFVGAGPANRSFVGGAGAPGSHGVGGHSGGGGGGGAPGSYRPPSITAGQGGRSRLARTTAPDEVGGGGGGPPSGQLSPPPPDSRRGGGGGGDSRKGLKGSSDGSRGESRTALRVGPSGWSRENSDSAGSQGPSGGGLAVAAAAAAVGGIRNAGGGGGDGAAGDVAERDRYRKLRVSLE